MFILMNYFPVILALTKRRTFHVPKLINLLDKYQTSFSIAVPGSSFLLSARQVDQFGHVKILTFYQSQRSQKNNS